MDKAPQSLLIIFYRNPVAGKVKTRLAATIGEERALRIFQELSRHTHMITEHLPVDKIVYYSDFVDANDIWSEEIFQKTLQYGDNLGEKMTNAFGEGFKRGYSHICIIGTDCYDLTEQIIGEAFAALQTADAVIGPARDGGYYLLGMKKLISQVFENKNWSTESVFQDTVRDFESLGLQYVALPVLRDVDRDEDIPEALK
jgi:rSAM/selenodomain-associated transferase 1